MMRSIGSAAVIVIAGIACSSSPDQSDPCSLGYDSGGIACIFNGDTLASATTHWYSNPCLNNPQGGETAMQITADGSVLTVTGDCQSIGSASCHVMGTWSQVNTNSPISLSYGSAATSGINQYLILIDHPGDNATIYGSIGDGSLDTNATDNFGHVNGCQWSLLSGAP